jgi:hypothetical protein
LDNYTGILRDVRLCIVDGDESFSFIYATVVSHKLSAIYAPGFWFSSSLIKQVYRVTDGYIFETINSTYYAESYVVVEISGDAIALIRAGVDPHTAMKMLGQEPLH